MTDPSTAFSIRDYELLYLIERYALDMQRFGIQGTEAIADYVGRMKELNDERIRRADKS